MKTKLSRWCRLISKRSQVSRNSTSSSSCIQGKKPTNIRRRTLISSRLVAVGMLGWEGSLVVGTLAACMTTVRKAGRPRKMHIRKNTLNNLNLSILWLKMCSKRWLLSYSKWLNKLRRLLSQQPICFPKNPTAQLRPQLRPIVRLLV